MPRSAFGSGLAVRLQSIFPCMPRRRRVPRAHGASIDLPLMVTELKMAPDAVLSLERAVLRPGQDRQDARLLPGSQFFCWDVAREAMLDGYPREIAAGWPGLLEAAAGRSAERRAARAAMGIGDLLLLRGAEAGDRVGHGRARDRRADGWTPASCCPSRLTQDDFTPVYAQLADGESVIYAFRGFEYTRWTIGASRPAAEDDGLPAQDRPRLEGRPGPRAAIRRLRRLAQSQLRPLQPQDLLLHGRPVPALGCAQPYAQLPAGHRNGVERLAGQRLTRRRCSFPGASPPCALGTTPQPERLLGMSRTHIFLSFQSVRIDSCSGIVAASQPDRET